MVPKEGLEPSHPKALAPHASVSTNFTISALNVLQIIVEFRRLASELHSLHLQLAELHDLE